MAKWIHPGLSGVGLSALVALAVNPVLSSRASQDSSTFGQGRMPRSEVSRDFLPGNSGGIIRNEACAKARIHQLAFDSIQKFKSHVNYCEVAVKDLPRDALALIERISALHVRMAAVLGENPATMFATPIGIMVKADFRGSIGSEARDGVVFLTALPDWSIEDFSANIYVHEVFHLVANASSSLTAKGLRGLRDHPFLIEALPDLVSAEVLASPRLALGERRLPECLRILRDASTIRSMDREFRHFYVHSLMDDVNACCATLDRESIDPFANAFCAQFAWAKTEKLRQSLAFLADNEIIAEPYTEVSLARPFEAANCRITTKNGLITLENCDSHQFAYPLISFFFRLRELTGESQVPAFLEILRNGAASASVYVCGYSGGSPAIGGAKAVIALRPVLGAFIALRESLSAGGQSAFDQAWDEHAFGKVMDLDRLYVNETLPGIAQLAVKAVNAPYRDLHGCENVYDLDPIACRVACEKKL